tara:strand:+ start:287 stop:913 length:627 start_codon:yes stop_codon:yes gene_type:complete
MENITNNIEATGTNIINNISNDFKTIKFYKSPAFYTFIIYVILIILFVFFIDNPKKKYLFGDIYMDKQYKIQWSKFLTVPYGYNTPKNIILSLSTNPSILYSLLFTILLPNIVDVKYPSSKPFFSGVLVSIVIIIILYIIHMILLKYIFKFKNDDNKIDDKINKDDKIKINKLTKDNYYSEIYQGQWLLLLFLSPIYAMILVYIFRKS